MSDMHLLHSSPILPEEIDRLGHLNVRYYMVRAYRANQELLIRLGLSREARKALGVMLGRNDSYTRFHREQHLGATLDVLGGVLEMGPHTLRTAFEIRNADTGEAAAAIVSEFQLEAGATREPIRWPTGLRERALAYEVSLSEHATPRTLDFEPPKSDVRFEDVLARVGEDGDGEWGALVEREITAEDCDAFGFLSEGNELMPGGGGRGQTPGLDRAFGPPIEANEDGRRVGWAVQELRLTQFRRPRVGDTLRSIGAVVRLYRKARTARRWTFDARTGAVVSIDDNVAVALDLDHRRAIEIPASELRTMAPRHAPEFA